MKLPNILYSLLLCSITILFTSTASAWSPKWNLDDNDTIVGISSPTFSGMMSIWGDLTSTGTVDANAFVGDGSLITGISAGINYVGNVRITQDASDTGAEYICDGTDDYVQFNAAATLLTSGGVIYVSSGTYDLGSSSWVISNSSITVIGAGQGTIIQCSGHSGDMTELSGDHTKFFNMTFDGQGTAGLQGLVFTSHRNEVSFCHFRDFGTSPARALYFNGGDYNQATFNSFYNCDYMAIAMTGGSLYNRIAFNYAEICATFIYTSVSHYNVWNNNVCYKGAGIQFWINTSQNNTIAGNVIEDNGAGHAIGLYNGDYTVVSGNNLYQNDQQGIYMDAASQYVTISGNQIVENDYDNSGTQHGIWINGSDYISITGNVFKDNDDHEISMASGSTNIIIVGNDFGPGADHVGYVEMLNNQEDVIMTGNFPITENYVLHVDTDTTPTYVGTRGVSKYDNTTVWRSTGTAAGQWVEESD